MPATIDGYLANATPAQRRALNTLRAQIKAVAPTATESISYGLPTFKLDGKRLVYFAAWADHLSIYGLGSDSPSVKKYASGRGTLRFQPDKPIPSSVIARLLKARIAAIKRSGERR